MGIRHLNVELTKWPVPSKPQENPPEAKPPVSNWQPRLPENLPPLPEESRNPTDIVQVQSLSVRSDVTKNPLNCWSANCPSNVLSVKSPKTSRLTCVSNLPPSWLSKRHLKLTWSVFPKIPTCAPSTPSVSPLCQRTSNLPAVSVVNVLKRSFFDELASKKRPFSGPTKYLKRALLLMLFHLICMIIKLYSTNIMSSKFQIHYIRT